MGLCHCHCCFGFDETGVSRTSSSLDCTPFAQKEVWPECTQLHPSESHDSGGQRHSDTAQLLGEFVSSGPRQSFKMGWKIVNQIESLNGQMINSKPALSPFAQYGVFASICACGNLPPITLLLPLKPSPFGNLWKFLCMT